MTLMLLALSCPITYTQNITKYPWNDFDRTSLARAKKRCGQIYPDAPCVKLFRKYNFQQYSVVCGKETK